MTMQDKQPNHRTKMLTQEEILGLLRVIRTPRPQETDGADIHFSTSDDLGAKANLSQTAVEVLLRHFRPLVVHIAKQYAHVGFEEALQEGYLALLRAIRDYDDTMGVPFAGYVFSKVRGDVRTAMRRLWRYEDRLSYVSHTQDGESDVDNTEEWDKQSASAAIAFDTWDEFDSADMRIIVESARLSPRERLAVLSMLDGQTCAELAVQEGVSTETVKTWRKRALHKLRAALGGEV